MTDLRIQNNQDWLVSPGGQIHGYQRNDGTSWIPSFLKDRYGDPYAGGSLTAFQLANPGKQLPGTYAFDWADVTLSTPTGGWTFTKETSERFGGRTTIKATATAGAGNTGSVVCTLPSAIFLGGAKKWAAAVQTGDNAISGGDNYAAQIWIGYSASSSHRFTFFAYPNYIPGQWSEGILTDQEISGSGHISGTPVWDKVAAEETTSVTIVVSKNPGQAIDLPVYISPLYTDPVTPATLTFFFDGQYEGQYKYARQLLAQYGIKASMAILPYWFENYPGIGTYTGTMSIAKALEMAAAGHEWIQHTGTIGPTGNENVGWNNTSKYPDASVYDRLRQDIQASKAFFRQHGMQRGSLYGVIAFTNGLTQAQSLSRRQDISRALLDEGMLKYRQGGNYLCPYFGAGGMPNMMIPQMRILTSADAASVGTGIIDSLIARGGWAGLTFHDIVLASATGNSVLHSTLKTILAYADSKVQAGQLRIQPFSVAMQEISSMRAPG